VADAVLRIKDWRQVVRIANGSDDMKRKGGTKAKPGRKGGY
jgi:hypothetical protein